MSHTEIGKYVFYIKEHESESILWKDVLNYREKERECVCVSAVGGPGH